MHMTKIKKGDIVKRKAYKNDMLFVVQEIINSVAILKGVTLRIEESEKIENLEIVKAEIIEKQAAEFERSIQQATQRIINNSNSLSQKKIKAKILHLDGDKKYSEKSAKVYSKLRLNAIVKNIKESRQPFDIKNLLDKYNPDIVIITGHDGMLKKGIRYNDIYNYRNSKYFIKTVEEARRWEQGVNKLAIFAGACQSYYEAILEAGANFASSPARILIDFMDPLIIAQKIAITPQKKYITIEDIRNNLRDGERGIGGIGTYGKLKL